MTGREQPQGLATKAAEQELTRLWSLGGLPVLATQPLLHRMGVRGAEADVQALTLSYAGNPLALKIAATAIRDLFGGAIAPFLAQGGILLRDIRELLDRQMQRLAALERAVMYWLAIAREGVSLETLQLDLLDCDSPSQLMDAVNGLLRRSLVEAGTRGFTQQPVIMEYFTQQFVDRICAELATTEPLLLHQQALLKVQAPDYLCDAQKRVILDPIVRELKRRHPHPAALNTQLQTVLSRLRQLARDRPSYGAGNIINLLRALHLEGTGYDFSDLAVWQADLRGLELRQANFARSDLARSLLPHRFGYALSVAFSPDGQLLASGDAAGQIHLWRSRDGQHIATLAEHSGWIWELAFSPDGTILASGGTDCTLKLWSVPTEKCLKTLSGDFHWILTLAFSPDGQTLASGGDDGRIQLWEVSTGLCYKTLSGHENWVLSIAFDREGRYLASASTDQQLKIWEVDQGTCVQTLVNGPMTDDPSNGWWTVIFGPTADVVISSGPEGTLKVWHWPSGRCDRTWQAHWGWIATLALTPDGKTLCSGSSDGAIALWDYATGQCLHVLRGHLNWIWTIAIAPIPVELTAGLSYVLASASHDMRVKLWDTRSGACLRTLQGHSTAIAALLFTDHRSFPSLDPPLFLSAGEDGKIGVWEADRDQCHISWRANAAPVFSLASCTLAHDNPLQPKDADAKLLVASGSMDRTLKVWDGQTGDCLRTFADPVLWPFQIDLSADGQQVASGSEGAWVKIWTLHTGECAHTLLGHSDWVWAVAFSPDSRTLASASDDRTIRLWSVKTGACLQVLSGHQNWIRAIAFTPDGQHLISGSGDCTLKIWDVQTGNCIQTLCGHEN
ncbi:MAG: hypothetical protein WCD18_22710, partial [Thermosynechococcaceae cyanobacterium]